MKEKKKYLILGTILVILIVIIVAVILVTNYQKQQKNNQTVDQSKINLNDAGKIENIEVKGDTKTNISEQLLKERTFNGLTIKNISLKSVKGTTTFRAKVVNETENIYETQEIKIILKDKNGQEYGTINGLIEEIQPHGERTIDASISIDLSNAYDFTIEEVNR